MIGSLVGYALAIPLLLVLVTMATIMALSGNPQLFFRSSKAIARAVPRVFGLRVKASGIERIDSTKTYVFMVNHVNIFDGFIVYGRLPFPFRFLELESHFNWPVYGTLVRRFGNIPIPHGNPREAVRTLDAAAAAVRGGMSLIIMPEGHRTRDGHLRPFLRGSFRIPLASGADIVPMALRGLYERKTVASRWVNPGPVELAVGEPIPFDVVKDLSEKELGAMVRARIEGLLAADRT